VRIESFWIEREKIDEDFLTNAEIEATEEIGKLLETINNLIQQDEDDDNMLRFILD